MLLSGIDKIESNPAVNCQKNRLWTAQKLGISPLHI